MLTARRTVPIRGFSPRRSFLEVTDMAVKIADIEACTGCSACTEVCPYEVLVVREEKVVVAQPEECVECGACVDECPNEVLELEEEE